jgi:molybdate transport system substrate-binding protein
VRSAGLGRAALLAVALAACGSGAPSGGAAEPVALTVFGAASLKGVLAEAKAAYEAARPGTTVTLATDSSAALATQIRQGAPVDVFLSADTATPEELVAEGLAAGDQVVFARNELAVIVPLDDPGGIETPADLARDGLLVIAVGDEAPISRYAAQLVANLAGLPGYPAGFVDAYAANVVSKEDSVKAVVAKIELGEGDAGIVYATDAAASSNVRVVPVPDVANVPATYAGVVVGSSPQPEAARAFLDWFAGPDGQAILERFGFLPPDR